MSVGKTDGPFGGFCVSTYSLSVAHAHPPISSTVMLVTVAVVVATRDLAQGLIAGVMLSGIAKNGLNGSASEAQTPPQSAAHGLLGVESESAAAFGITTEAAERPIWGAMLTPGNDGFAMPASDQSRSLTSSPLNVRFWRKLPIAAVKAGDRECAANLAVNDPRRHSWKLPLPRSTCRAVTELGEPPRQFRTDAEHLGPWRFTPLACLVERSAAADAPAGAAIEPTDRDTRTFHAAIRLTSIVTCDSAGKSASRAR